MPCYYIPTLSHIFYMLLCYHFPTLLHIFYMLLLRFICYYIPTSIQGSMSQYPCALPRGFSEAFREDFSLGTIEGGVHNNLCINRKHNMNIN